MVINKDLRLRILEVGREKKMGHYGSSMSCLDCIKFLYDNVIKEDDIFILSKGHGAPALHAVLEQKGFHPPWTIHNEYDEENGIKATTGSLGLGLPTAIGRAFAKKLKNENGYVYCMVGDGEMQEGVIWESLNIAKRFSLTNFILIIDHNKYQAITSVKEIMEEDEQTLKAKIEAFGFDCHTIKDGHNNECMAEFDWKFSISPRPQAVILHTQKGKGIPFLERNPSFHVVYQHEREEEFKEAVEELSK